MNRKTLRKRVSKKSRKTRNKNISKRKTRINKKHYSRKMRGGWYYLGEYKTKSSVIINYYLIIIEKNVKLRWSSNNTDLLDTEINNIYDSVRKVFSPEYHNHISTKHETSVANAIEEKILDIIESNLQ